MWKGGEWEKFRTEFFRAQQMPSRAHAKPGKCQDFAGDSPGWCCSKQCITYPNETVKRKCSHQGATCCHAVRGQQLLLADGWRTGAVRVVDHGIERLVEPLPEDDGGCRLVERHHASSDGHVHRHLSRHTTDEQHLFAGVRMECTVV